LRGEEVAADVIRVAKGAVDVIPVAQKGEEVAVDVIRVEEADVDVIRGAEEGKKARRLRRLYR
jgi:hypothetical protein